MLAERWCAWSQMSNEHVALLTSLARLSIARSLARSSGTDGDTISSSNSSSSRMVPAAAHGGRWLQHLTICSDGDKLLALYLLEGLDATSPAAAAAAAAAAN